MNTLQVKPFNREQNTRLMAHLAGQSRALNLIFKAWVEAQDYTEETIKSYCLPLAARLIERVTPNNTSFMDLYTLWSAMVIVKWEK